MPDESRKRPSAGGRFIIIGVGNLYRSDDAAGLLAARALRKRVKKEIAVLERDGEPAALIAAFEGAGAVIIIDAVCSGSPPGAVRVMDAREAPLDRNLFRRSTHAFGVAEAVALAGALGKAPPVMWIVGIEGKSFEHGTRVSQEVLQGVEEAAQAALGKMTELIAGADFMKT